MIRERWRLDRDGWRLSLFVGIARLAVGFWYDAHPSESSLEVYLGPLTVVLWRAR